MYFGGLGDGGKLVYDQGNLCGFGESDRGRQALLLRFLAIPFLQVVAFLAAPARLVFDRLLFQMLEGFVDGGLHVAGLGFADQRSVARADGDFRFVAALFDGQDHFGIKFVAQDFADFGQAGFD